MLRREPYIKCSHYHVLETSIYFIVRFLISIRVVLESFTFPYGHGQKRVWGLGDSTTCYKSYTKCPRSLLKGFYWPLSQSDKPVYGHRPKAGGEYLAHKSFIARMNYHLLIETAYMLHKVRFSIIDGESWLWELMGKPSLADSPKKWGLRNLPKCFTHHVIPHGVVRWPLPAFVLALFQFILAWWCWEGLTKWGSWPMAIWVIPTSPWSITWWGWRTPSITLLSQ